MTRSTHSTRATASAVADKIDEALAANDAGNDVATASEDASAANDGIADEAPVADVYGNMTSFTKRDVPWAALGAQIDASEVVTAAEAAELGGLNFKIELYEAGFKLPKAPKVGQSPWQNVGTRRASVRADTGQFFAYVSNTYKPIQYAEAFAFMDEVNPHYVAAGTLANGRQGFMVVEHPDVSRVLGDLKLHGQEDPHKLYVVLRTSHDLSRALEVSILTLRGQCMNGISLKSFSRAATNRWSIRHVGKDPLAKLEAARRTLARTVDYAEEFKKIANRLSEIDIEVEEAERVLKLVLPDRPKREEQVSAILGGWRESPTNGFTKDGWGLTQAVSEYFEWGRDNNTRTAQSRFTSGIQGDTYRYTNRTAQLLLRRAA